MMPWPGRRAKSPVSGGRPCCAQISKLPLSGVSRESEPLSAGNAAMMAARMLLWAEVGSGALVARAASAYSVAR